MRGIKIPQYEFAPKMQGGLMHEGGAYLRDTTVSVTDVVQNWFDRESTDEQGICNFLCSHN